MILYSVRSSSVEAMRYSEDFKKMLCKKVILLGNSVITNGQSSLKIII